MFHKTILSEVHRWVQSARRCQQVGLTKPLQGEYSQYHSVYKCVPALFLCFFCCESFSWSIMSTDSAAGSGRNEHVPVTSFFPSLLPPFAANFSRRFSSMACANHTILLASSIFNPLIDVSFWKCRCRFAFPMGQSLCCLFNDYIYIYIYMSCKSSDKRCPCCKLGWDRVKFRVIFLLLVQSHYHLTHPLTCSDSAVVPVWLSRPDSPVTQELYCIILYPPSSLTRSHKISQASVCFCHFSPSWSLGSWNVLELWPCCSHLFARAPCRPGKL